MKRFVEGHYATPETAIMAVESLVAKGYSKADMTFVTNTTSARNLADFPGVRILAHDEHLDEDDDSWWDNIRDFFAGRRDSDTDPGDVIDSDSLLREYRDYIHRGEIVLLVEEGGTRVPGDADYQARLDDESNLDRDGRVIPVAGLDAGRTSGAGISPYPGDHAVPPYIPDIERSDPDTDLKR